MPLKRNCTSGGCPAAAAFVNCGITLFVSISVELTVIPVWLLNLASVSVIHFWIPTASCWPHHHIFREPALRLPTLPGAARAPREATRGPSAAAPRPPAVSLSRRRRDSGRDSSSTVDLQVQKLAQPIGPPNLFGPRCRCQD